MSEKDTNKPVSVQAQTCRNIEAMLNEKCKSLTLYKLNNKNNPKGKFCNSTIGLGFRFVVFPSLFCIYPFVLLFFSCINRDTGYNVSLFWSLMGIYLAGLILLCVKMWIFVCNAKFCTELHLANHEFLNWAIFLDYSSILLAYELYAYTVNFFAVIAVVIFWILYFLLYASVFLEGHVRPCPALVTGEEKKKIVNSVSKCLLISTIMVQFAFVIVAVVLNSQLTEGWRIAKENNGECLTPS
jgi:multisubunit Na+/H+ antiporter MnhC subunit